MRILYLDLDTLRPDHLGCYGYRRNTSPNIDRIAAEGTRFDNYHCTDAPCLPSRAALMSGRFGIHTGIVGHGGTCADMRLQGSSRGFRSNFSSTALPVLLKSAGLHTVFIGGFAERHSSQWFYTGFREIYDTGAFGMESAEEVTPTVLDWIRRNGRRDNWYLHVNYWDPHAPYRAPATFGNPFAAEPLPAWFSEELVRRHRQVVGPHTARELNMYDSETRPQYPRSPGEVRNLDDVRRVIDGYDTGIRYMDQHIGELLGALADQGVGEDLAVIVSSDHGENLGELGIYAEHGTADQITTRIPMIVRWPGGVKGHAAPGLQYNIDLVPTLADLLGKPVRPEWDGQSYAATIRQGADAGRPYLVLSQCAHVCQRAVRWGSHIYIRTYHDGFRLYPDEMLFDVARDPHEQQDLAPSRPDLCQEARGILTDWYGRMMTTMPEGYDADPLWTVIQEGGPYHARGHLPAYCKRLEATERGWAVEELRKRHPREFQGL